MLESSQVSWSPDLEFSSKNLEVKGYPGGRPIAQPSSFFFQQEAALHSAGSSRPALMNRL